MGLKAIWDGVNQVKLTGRDRRESKGVKVGFGLSDKNNQYSLISVLWHNDYDKNITPP